MNLCCALFSHAYFGESCVNGEPDFCGTLKQKSRRHDCRRRVQHNFLIINIGGTLKSKFMHKIAGLVLPVGLIGISSFSQSAPSKPAANPAPRTATHSAATSPQIPIPDIKYTKFV